MFIYAYENVVSDNQSKFKGEKNPWGKNKQKKKRMTWSTSINNKAQKLIKCISNTLNVANQDQSPSLQHIKKEKNSAIMLETLTLSG